MHTDIQMANRAYRHELQQHVRVRRLLEAVLSAVDAEIRSWDEHSRERIRKTVARVRAEVGEMHG